MKRKYEIEGMSSGDCLDNVSRALAEVSEVTVVEVQLNPQIATITMKKSVDVETLQAQLTLIGDYTIKEPLTVI